MKRYFDTPVKKNMGKKTMQMESVETRAGTAICDAPPRIASRCAWPSSKKRSMFSIVTVASSTRMPTARASPPRVMRLIVSPRELRTSTDVRIERGMDTAMMSVLRLANHTTDGGTHENRLVSQRQDFQLRRQGLGKARKQLPDSFHHVNRGCIARLQDAEKNSPVSIVAHDVGLRRESVANVGDISQINCREPDLLDRKIV